MTALEGIANELHRPARKNFQRRKVITRFTDEYWQTDLADIQMHSRKNNGFKYILVVIDTFSKYLWAEPLKNKTAISVKNAMLKILKNQQPKLLQSDLGAEYYNHEFKQLMSKYGIKHYSTYSSIKAGVAERVIRTLKQLIYRNFTAKGSWNWVAVLPKLVNSYNNSKHRTINCTPHEARKNPALIKHNNN